MRKKRNFSGKLNFGTVSGGTAIILPHHQAGTPPYLKAISSLPSTSQNQHPEIDRPPLDRLIRQVIEMEVI